MTKFHVRAQKVVFAPKNVEVEANTYKEAATLGLAKIQEEYPNWIERIHHQDVTDLEIWNASSTKRTISFKGAKMLPR